MLGRVPAFDIFKCLLFVNVDEDVAIDGFKNTGGLHFARLEYHVAVCQNDRLSPFAETLQHVERPGVKAIGEWVINQEIGRRDQVGFVGVFDPKTLQSPQVIAIAQLVKEFLLDRPKLVPAPGPEFPLNMPLKISLNPVVLQQGVIHIYQKDYRGGFFHDALSTFTG